MTSIEESITTRRTSKHSLATPVAKDLLIDLLAQASAAPYHKKEPWLVKLVTTTEEKDFLYDRIIQFYEESGVIHDEKSREKLTAKMNRLIRNAPATLLFAHEVYPDKKRLTSDAALATAALIQNFSLLLAEHDLVGFWASSAFTLEPDFAKKIGLPDNYSLIANYRVGYRDPDAKVSTGKRRPPSEWISDLRG